MKVNLQISKEAFKKKLGITDPVPFVLEGETIVEKINDMPIDPDFQIDAKHIKNLPNKQPMFGGGLSRGAADSLYQPIQTPRSKTLIYTSGSLTRVNSADGTYKTMSYVAGVLTSLFDSSTNKTKTFAYTDGALTTITVT